MAKEEEKLITPVRRRLSDLYVTGVEESFDDPETGDKIKVWVQKLTPAEEKIAVTKARPAKAKIATIKRLPEDHEDKFFYYDKLDETRFSSVRKKLEFLVESEVAEYSMSAEAEIAEEDEWAKDDYLIGLQEAWNQEVKEAWARNPEDPDANRVYLELKRFTDAVEEAIDDRRNQLIYEIQDLEEDQIDRRCVKKMIEDDSTQEMYAEFRKWQIYLATRDIDDHSKQYFRDRKEVDQITFEVYVKLLAAYMGLAVEGIEGKGWPGTRAS